MKYLTILLLGLITIKTYAQDTQEASSTSGIKRIQIGVNFSPDICFRKLKNNDGSSTSKQTIESLNDRETIKFGYTAGLNVHLNINKLIGLEAGIQYSNKGYQTKMRNLYSINPDPLMPGLDYMSKYVYSFHYIDIPLKANFTMGNRKIRFFTSAGITTNILIKETQTRVLKSSTEKTDRDTEPTNFDYKSFNLSPTISAGIDYKMNNKMHLRIEPTFRYGILKIIGTSITSYLWNSGINTSYCITL